MLQSAASSYPAQQNHLSFYKTEPRTSYCEKQSAELIPFVIDKSESAFNKLYYDYADALYGVLEKLVAEKSLIEDLLQESFIKIWKYADRYDSSKGSLYTWMLNIARNTGIDYLRSGRHYYSKKNVSIEVMLFEMDSKAQVPSSEKLLDFKEFKNTVSRLDEKYALLIHIIYFLGYTQQQAAEFLNLPIGTIKTRTRRAITLLKKL
ncbi:sigma-70 family RNA polymerase sigma factor [soil metagenome]